MRHGLAVATLARVTRASKIIGIDPSKTFIEYARTQITDPRVTLEIGDAQNVPYPDNSFDQALGLLVVNFIPDAPKAVNEMRPVTKSGGVVANHECGTAAELMN